MLIWQKGWLLLNRLIYTLLLYLMSPFLLGWMALRARQVGGRWQVLGAARFGHYRHPLTTPIHVWVHAASLGEMRAAQPLVKALLDEGKTVLLTHLTYTGRAEGERLFAAAILQGQLIQQWLPYDFPGAVRRFYKYYRPQVGVLIEREVWPNLLLIARRQRIPMVLASARFSARALRQSVRIGRLMQAAYRSFTAVYAQSLRDAQRLEIIGARAVRVSGNFKFDVRASTRQIDSGARFAERLGRRIIVIASTREGEEEQFIHPLRRYINEEREQDLDPLQRTLFYIIPRHPQRFEEVYQLLQEQSWSVVRRSELLAIGDGTRSSIERCREVEVVLGDTLGELPWYYAQASIAIVGGSFGPFGGQNFIEACAVGVPVIVGPHTRNFEQAVQDALAEQAIVQVPGAAAALKEATRLLHETSERTRLAEAGLHWMHKHRGSVQRVLTGLNKILERQNRQAKK